MKTIFVLIAACTISMVATTIFSAPVAVAQSEDCGTPPTGIKALLGDAKERFDTCKNLREAEQQKELLNTFGRGLEACKSILRKSSKHPSTLSFHDGLRYILVSGLKESGFSYTEGGYSVIVTGSDASGPFRVQCYTDKNFKVTHVNPNP